MSWQDIMQRVLPPVGGLGPEVTSAYGAVKGRVPPSSIPHGGVDFNYPVRQTGINLTHPALRSPVAGIVTNAGQGTVGRIAIRDANGYSHEILHTNGRYVSVGDPVAAGQLIGTMGNTGTHDQHVHYQLKDPAGNIVNPSAFWDRQGPADPIPSQPDYLQEYQKYLQGLGINAGNGLDNVPEAASAMPSAQPNNALSPDHQNSFGGRFGNWGSSPASISPLLPSDRPGSLDNRFGNWGSAPASGFGDTDSPLLRALEKRRSSATPDGPASLAAAPSSASFKADKSLAPMFDPSDPPPLFALQNYSTAPGNNSIEKWIASLTGADPEDATPFSMPAMFNPYLGR